MFSLIITIISIALVAALAVATIYYGGSAFTNGSARASAATVVSHAQQIAGANTLFANDNSGTYSTSVTGLRDGGYLSSVPAVPTTVATAAYTVSSGNLVNTTIASAQICAQINKSSTGSEVSSLPAGVSAQYGCHTNPLQFHFRG
jgi:Flp pilus assembly protein TadG